MYLVFLSEKKRENGSVHETPHRRDTRSRNSLVRSKTQGKVPGLEIKNQTYEKLMQTHNKVKLFKCQGVWLLSQPPPPPPILFTSLLQGATSIL